MRISINKTTGRILEMQSHATEGTLIANAIAAGFTATDIEEREVDDAGYTALLAAQPQSAEEYIALARAVLATTDITVLRCVEAAVAVPTAWVAYRQALRAIIAGTATGPLPTKPSTYPSGT